MEACTGDNRRHLFALVTAALDTGARLGELLRLTWAKVFFEDDVIEGLISYKGKAGKILKRHAPLDNSFESDASGSSKREAGQGFSSTQIRS